MIKLSRRQFAKSATAGLILAPFYQMLQPVPAKAAGKVKRVLLFCSMGTSPDLWTPTRVGGPTDFSFSAATAPLAKIKQHLVLIEGLPSGNPGNGHGAPDGLAGTGYGNALSVDQFLGDRLKAAGVNAQIPTLLLGAETSAGGGRTMFNRGDNLATISSPDAAFKTVFGAAPAPTAGGGPAGDDKRLARRKRVVDLVKSEVTQLKGVLGKSQQQKMEMHLQSIEQVENRLSSGGGAISCGSAKAPEGNLSDTLIANMAHLDIAVQALACDITRVAAVQFGSDQSMAVDLPGLKGDQHGGFLHSGAPNFEQLVKMEIWLAERFVDVVEKLKATPEADGSGSLLDNTIVAWCRDMGDAVVHNQQNMRFVLAGGEGKYLKTHANGRYLKGAGGGANRHERVLLNLCEAVGVTNFSGFGDPKLTGADKTPIAAVGG